MKAKNSVLEKLKPAVPKRTLLFIAGSVWAFAGGMLLWRGVAMLSGNGGIPVWVQLIGCAAAGGLFYGGIFRKISAKHTRRIQNLPSNRPCAFAFFNAKGYLMMALMIAMGIALRTTGIVPARYLALLYITMGIPLAVSAARFYLAGARFRSEAANS